MLKQLVNECEIKLTITSTGPLLIKSGHANVYGSDMTPVVTRRIDREGEEEPFIPGSSFKGVLRSHFEKVSRTFNKESVCDPFAKFNSNARTRNEEIYRDVFCGEKFQIMTNKNKELNKTERIKISSAFVYKNSCLACRLFGSTFFTGRLAFNDAYMKENGKFGVIERRDGIGIDRFTGGTSDGAKFDLEVVRTGTNFETQLYLRNYEIWQLGVLLLLLHDLKDGLIRLGSGKSRGLGSIKACVDSIRIAYIIPLVEEMPKNTLWGLGHFIDDSYDTANDDYLQLDEDLSFKDSYLRREMVLNPGENGTHELYQDLTREGIRHYVQHCQNKTFPDEMTYSFLSSLGEN